MAPIPPMLACAGNLPDGDDWAYEFKWDGIRTIVEISAGRAHLFNRSLKDVSERYPELEAIGAAAGEADLLLDGELVALDEEGRPSFQALQPRIHLGEAGRVAHLAATSPVTLMVFDLLRAGGTDLIGQSYVERRSLLDELALAGPRWQTPPVSDGPVDEVLDIARAHGLEGVVAKRRDSRYLPGARSRAWIKHRLTRSQELVVGGYRPGEGSRAGRVGSLLVGYYDVRPAAARKRGEPQRLVYAGAVGSGLADRDLDRLGQLLAPLERADTPFAVGDPMAHGSFPHAKREPRFVEPELVVEVEFTEWTREGTMRQPVFRGLRDDKDPRTVVREA